MLPVEKIVNVIIYPLSTIKNVVNLAIISKSRKSEIFLKVCPK